MKNLETGHQAKEQNKAPVANFKEIETYKVPKKSSKTVLKHFSEL